MLLLSPKSLVKNKAFTLVELMVVILIIGVLVTVMAGAVVKWMAWQRDPTNPNSSVSQTINTIKQAVTRITQDIQQKAKQDYQALSAGDKTYYQTLGSNLFSKNVNPAATVIGEPDPNARAIQVFFNTQIVRNFPISVDKILSTGVARYDFDFTLPSPIKSIVLDGTNPYNYNNFFASMTSTSLVQQLLTVNTIIKNKPAAASTPNRDSSACLLVALESHPKGLKVEDLGSGSISTDSTGVRIIQPGGAVIYHKIHYVDAADYAADKSFKVGSLRVDIAYDTE
ncbi:MAG: type II secretion system protein [Planctomycetota bacterium]|nr:MAG: type II secretion system protein [Planctomycetota bacterium]